MILDRRTFISASAALGFSGCAKVKAALAKPGTGWIVSAGGQTIASNFSGQAVIGGAAFGADNTFRIASITKLVVGMAIYDLAAAGALNLDAPVADILPNTPDDLTLRHLLSHRSGLKDPAIYWAALGDDIRDLYTRADFTHPPATYFRYANLNYGLAATVVEARLGDRFDLLMWKWLTRHSFDAGLNWSGVSPKTRKSAAAIYRKKRGKWAATVDAPYNVPLVRPFFIGGDKLGLPNYKLASNGTLFSPQGGMRMSLSDLIKVGELLHTRPLFHAPAWTNDGNNAETEDNHFLSFGPANYLYTAEQSPIPGVSLVGHLGEAYGAYTGLFIVPDTNITFAFAQLGTPQEGLTMTGSAPNQSVEHQALFDALAPSLRALI